MAQPSRIAGRIDNGRTISLPGRVRPAANTHNDRGPADPALALPGITLLLKPSSAQQADLEQLLQQQQDPASSSYHRWLSPEGYASRFGVSSGDMAEIVAWAQSQGFQVTNVARGRTFVSLRGTAQQAQAAFHTEIHRYVVNGQRHFANASDPAIPAALADVVAGVLGLNDFHPNPRLRKPAPQMNSASGQHHLAPDDFATIYDVAALYSAGVDGTGQSIAIVGQSDIDISDIQTFRNKFNLSAPKVTQILVGQTDPGISPGDVDESNLDIEWSGAVARNATILFYYSTDVWQSAIYAVDDDKAAVLSISYGGCEQGDLVDLPSYRVLVQQANAEGMTWFAAAGDQGGADCEDQGADIAQNGLAVDVPSSIPEVTSMGGTEFNEQVSGGYWASTNNPQTSASALEYIPEMAWNDTVVNGQLAATGGGASVYFPQPAWQTGPGVPTDGFRHVPDLSLNASADHDSYYFYSTGSPGYVGGTSAAAPTMAGVFSLLNQYLASSGAQAQPGLGNVNPAIYRLAQSPSAGAVFHDVTVGGNQVPCANGTPNCTNGAVGFLTAPNYDSVTGWGSVDAYNLVHQWSTVPAQSSSVQPSIDQNPVFQQTPDVFGNAWRFKLTLTEEAGIGTTVTGFTIDGVDHSAEIPALLKSAAISPGQTVSFSYGLANVAVPKTVAFGFTGVDASGATWTRQLSVPFSGPQTHLTVAGISNAATGQQVYAPGMILSVYGTAMGDFAQAALAIPLPQYLAGFEAIINGVPAPLYYVSPNQVNVQIPYETQTGEATLTVGNPYENVNYSFTVAAAGPGIFTFPDGSINPSRAASVGQMVTLFLTGDGQVSPSLATGTTPGAGTRLSQLPKPRLPVSMTVGGVPATIAFIGITSGLVGVTQINFTVPTGIAPGVQPVVVTVGTTASPAANITVTQ
ncbi:MAG TPA: protease pro-enzyme activation domain-containing protein [Bryobacteraceae bacterium]|nr:protease pro-enzyme activation domain-containing protein [Bryobacteraceae bacterium]